MADERLLGQILTREEEPALTKIRTGSLYLHVQLLCEQQLT